MAEARIESLPECARWSLRMPAPLAEETRDVAGFRLDIALNRGVDRAGRLSARLGPDEWLLCAPAGEQLDCGALEGKRHSLVDVSHRYAAFLVEGPQSAAVLAAGCPLDLHPAVFVAGSASRTLLGKAEIVLWRISEASAYRIECARSYAKYVARVLEQAV
jgi:sarcosine oxidase subunit gamma